jgi:hypothetical protein
MAKVRISALRANLLAGLVGIPVAVLCLILARVFGCRSDEVPFTHILIALAIFLPVSVAHELLHAAAALVYGHLRLTDLRVGVNWKVLGLACHLRVPVRVGAARIIAVAPLAVMEPILLALLAVYPSNVTAMLVAFVFIGAVVDLWMLYKLRRFDANLLFIDHPGEPTFEIYASP